jgi:predicted Zn-dependent protease with MMP-like domain
VESVLETLPQPLREKASRVPITFEPCPNPGLQSDGIAPDTLGLFTGSELADEGMHPMPAQISLFLDNRWAFSGQAEAMFRSEVRTTLLHELGHYLGLDEEDLTARGLE